MRLGIAMLAAATIVTVGCAGEAENSEAQERADAKAIAQVKAAQIAPPLDVELQPIAYDDIIEHPEMEGAGCSFYPSGEEDPLAIMGGDVGFLRIDGAVQRLAADAGSAEGPSGTRTAYDGREYSLRVAIDDAEREAGEGYYAAPASIRVVDGYDRELASDEGRVGCGG